MQMGASGTTLSESSMSEAVEGLAAFAVIALAIIALAGIVPKLLACIAAIVLGGSMMVDGWTAYARYRERIASGVVGQFVAIRGNLSGEFLGGVAGVVLGILAFFRGAPDILLAVAVLVFGATLLLSGTTPRLQWLFAPPQLGGTEAAKSVSVTAPGGQLLVGLAAVVLGILAIIGMAQMTLILVGLLTLGAGMALTQMRL